MVAIEAVYSRELHTILSFVAGEVLALFFVLEFQISVGVAIKLADELAFKVTKLFLHRYWLS